MNKMICIIITNSNETHLLVVVFFSLGLGVGVNCISATYVTVNWTDHTMNTVLLWIPFLLLAYVCS